MEKEQKSRKKNKVKTIINKVYSGFDFTLLICVLCLMTFGIIVIYTATSQKYGMIYLKSQVFYSAIALLGLIFFLVVDYHVWYRFGKLYYWAAIVSIFLVKVIPANVKNGALRSIKIGPVTISVVELAKTFMIMFFAYYMCNCYRKIKEGYQNEIFVVVLSAIVSALVYKINNNLSTALIISGIGVSMLFVLKKHVKLFLVCMVIGVAGYIFAGKYSLKLGEDAKRADYLNAEQGNEKSEGNFRNERLLAWKNLDMVSEDKGYQTIHALYAIGSGGFIGKGLGNGSEKTIVPEAQNDMAYAIVCEEFGYWGSLFLLIAYMMLIWRIFWVAQNAPDLYGSLICTAVAMHLSIQVFLHMAVNVNFIPNTGVTLPFISSGGSALIFTLAEIGLVLGVSGKIRLEDD
ncbi:MAG: FtsW/RodA/SpoVE family cell cycle protein [Lachnospiraceae bacterium]|nr:FtsW/RodA/SpoVE family cell cycle protein [Lachnospiraceae bacterium]